MNLTCRQKIDTEKEKFLFNLQEYLQQQKMGILSY